MIMRVSKGISSLLIFSWVLLFLCVEPTHHHDDNQSHHECGICLVASQSIVNASHFAMPVSQSIVCEAIPISQSQYVSSVCVSYTSRSPPVSC